MIKKVEKQIINERPVAVVTITGDGQGIAVMNEFRARGNNKPLYRDPKASVTIYTTLEFDEDGVKGYLPASELTIKTSLDQMASSDITSIESVEWYVDTLVSMFAPVENVDNIDLNL